MTESIQGALLHCPEGRYTRLPDALLSELSPREHQLVHALLSFRWFDDSPIFPRIATLAERVRCSTRTVQRTLRSLEGKGYLVTVARYRDESDGGQTSNQYAPGPLLMALLPPAGSQPVAPPVTRTAHHEGNTRNTTHRTGFDSKNTAKKSKDYLETRYGTIAQASRCGRCASLEHSTAWCLL